MTGLENGMLVQHSSLGVGKVVALEPTAVHVFFADGDHRFAAKLRLPFALGLLRTEDVPPSAVLDGFAGFTLDEKSGRYAPAREPAARKPRATAAAKRARAVNAGAASGSTGSAK